MKHVLIADEAFEDMEGIWDAIARLQSEDAATRILTRLVDAVLKLGEFPKAHPRRAVR